MLCFDQFCEKNLTSECHRGRRHCLKQKWREKDLFNGILEIFHQFWRIFLLRTHTPLPTFRQTPPSPPKRHPPPPKPEKFSDPYLSTYGAIQRVFSFWAAARTQLVYLHFNPCPPLRVLRRHACLGMGSSLDSNSQTRNFAVYLANSHKLETRILTRESSFSAILREN